jgi:hypothetical protein
MMNSSVALPTKAESAALPRICSGACAFFNPVYMQGRKIAGKGTCANHAAESETAVGSPCIWKLTRYSRRHDFVDMAD